jgi:hypothetical protein
MAPHVSSFTGSRQKSNSQGLCFLRAPAVQQGVLGYTELLKCAASSLQTTVSAQPIRENKLSIYNQAGRALIASQDLCQSTCSSEIDSVQHDLGSGLERCKHTAVIHPFLDHSMLKPSDSGTARCASWGALTMHHNEDS